MAFNVTNHQLDPTVFVAADEMTPADILDMHFVSVHVLYNYYVTII
jgi:hypothetical protein